MTVITQLVKQEYDRQQGILQMIASENLPTPLVYELSRHALLSYKTAEGYAGKRYFSGCEVVDEIEQIGIGAATQVFGAQYANLQPNTATDANHAVFKALIRPSSKVLSLDLKSGGHLSHNVHPEHVVHYRVDPCTRRFDYAEIAAIAERTRPDVIIAGGSSYPQEIDYAAFRRIADSVGAFLMADIAHTAGFVAGGLHQSPIDHAHVTTGSTYKTLRGPRSGFIVAGRDAFHDQGGRPLADVLSSALFPGTQGSPNMAFVAAKAACFLETATPAFAEYIRTVRDHSQRLAQHLADSGFDIVSGGTASHIVLLDLSCTSLNGLLAERALYDVGIMVNRNQIPYDHRPPRLTSGVRLGTQFMTCRGINQDGIQEVAECIAEVLATVTTHSDTTYHLDPGVQRRVRRRVAAIADQFPMPYHFEAV